LVNKLIILFSGFPFLAESMNLLKNKERLINLKFKKYEGGK